MQEFAGKDVVGGVTSVWSSTERKAVEAAEILAAARGLEVRVERDLGENDRTATGFLPPAEFEQVADRFFADPESSVRGWERAVDAQARIRHAVDRIVTSHKQGDLAIVSHGAVGTLLLCAYLGHPVDRKEDQPFQGHYWIASLPTKTVLHGWKPIA